MKTLPDGLDDRDVRTKLAEHWDFVADTVEYVPEGFGSYHWIAADADGARRFVTIDDLDTKSWLGTTREAAFDGLRGAFDVASTLRHRANLSFVVAPLRTRDEETIVRLDERHATAVYPIAPGASGDFGDRPTSHQRLGIIDMLVELHRATPLVRSTASRCDVSIPGRDVLMGALADLDRSWDSGPYAERARAALAHGRSAILRLLPVFDGLVDGVAAQDPLVITHGEPHLGNVMRDGDTLALVDWDTVGLALPERDLWIIDGITDDELATYAAASGRRVSRQALDVYRLRWDLADIAEYTRVLRAPHRETADTESSAQMLDHYVRRQSGWDAFLS